MAAQVLEGQNTMCKALPPLMTTGQYRTEGHGELSDSVLT